MALSIFVCSCTPDGNVSDVTTGGGDEPTAGETTPGTPGEETPEATTTAGTPGGETTPSKGGDDIVDEPDWGGPAAGTTAGEPEGTTAGAPEGTTAGQPEGTTGSWESEERPTDDNYTYDY